jgi:hypothetical protein
MSFFANNPNSAIVYMTKSNYFNKKKLQPDSHIFELATEFSGINI